MSPARLIQITDTHLGGPDATQAARWAQQLRDVHTAAAPRPGDLLLATGDIAEDGSAAAYRQFRALTDPPCPVVVLPGNHDDPAILASTLGAWPAARLGDDHHFGGWRLLSLNSHLPGRIEGRLGAERLARLQAMLAAEPATPTALAVHHPPLPLGADWIDQTRLEDGPVLLQLLQRHPQVRLVLCGHVHQARRQRLADLTVLTTPATSRQFAVASDTFALDPQQGPGWREVHLYPDGHWQSVVHRLPAAA